MEEKLHSNYWQGSSNQSLIIVTVICWIIEHLGYVVTDIKISDLVLGYWLLCFQFVFWEDCSLSSSLNYWVILIHASFYLVIRHPSFNIVSMRSWFKSSFINSFVINLIIPKRKYLLLDSFQRDYCGLSCHLRLRLVIQCFCYQLIVSFNHKVTIAIIVKKLRFNSFVGRM